jgi:hypothetical protein
VIYVVRLPLSELQQSRFQIHGRRLLRQFPSSLVSCVAPSRSSQAKGVWRGVRSERGDGDRVSEWTIVRGVVDTVVKAEQTTRTNQLHEEEKETNAAGQLVIESSDCCGDGQRISVVPCGCLRTQLVTATIPGILPVRAEPITRRRHQNLQHVACHKRSGQVIHPI